MSTWADLSDEAARWREAGRTAELWWRDDDAADVGPALERLLAIHRDTGVPLALAVVPATATQALADRLAGEPGVDLLQHGYAHVNHAAPGDKKIELGTERPAMLVLGELGTGRMALERLFGDASLAGAGAALEPHRAGPGADLAGDRLRRSVDLRCAAPHASGERAFAGQHPRRLDRLEGRPRLCRRGRCTGTRLLPLWPARAASGEPVGVLSHHLAMDGGAWDFLRSMWQKALKMPGLRVRPAHELFATGGSRG